MSLKAELRSRYRGISYPKDAIKEKSKSIVQRLQKIITEDKNVAVYCAIQNEPEVDEFFSQRLSSCLFPKVDGDKLTYYSLKEPQFKSGAFGVREPDPQSGEVKSLSDAEVALVPGLLFDRRGARLGRGKGFYDKALKNYNGIKIGVCFQDQLINEDIPTETHDIFMNLIVTENFIYSPYHNERK